MFVPLDKLFRKFCGRIFYRSVFKDVPVENLLHDNSWCYMEEGYGGKPFNCWPIYKFISRYYKGDKDSVTLEWTNWYIDQYKKYRKVPKDKGGMKGGGVDSLVRQYGLSDSNYSTDNPEIFEAIEERVQKRFCFVDCIRKTGYKPDRKNPVKGYQRTDGTVILKGGHHRVALLAAMGKEQVPSVLVREPRKLFQKLTSKHRV